MPKSRFNAVREKARASRHNPLHRTDNKTDKDGKSNQLDAPLTLQPIQGDKSNTDVLPLLKSLPLPNSPSTSSYEDALWALTSLNGFWSTKALRNELLSPKHDIISRILVQLQRADDRPIEVRDAASGCLRNLCIEAGGKVRKALESKGSMNACIEEMNFVANDLGLKEGDVATTQERRLQNNRAPHHSKDKNEMNRKERRQAAKAEAALSKRQSTAPAKEENNSTKKNGHEEMDQDTNTTKESDDDRVAVRCSHLNNLAAVIWCLAEMSPQAANECERASPLLCRIISQTVQRGVKALQNQRSQPIDPKSDGKINVGKKDQKVIDEAWIEASSTCLNALVTLSDSNPNVCAALVGIERPELMAAMKKKKQTAVVMDDVSQEGVTRKEGKENVQSLCSAIDLLQQAHTTGEGDRRVTSLGLLALATLRNVQSSLPLALSRSLKVQREGGESVSLSDYESNSGLQALQHILNKGTSGEASQEDIRNLNLALEVLAELVGDRESWSAGTLSSVVDEEKVVTEGEDDEEMEMEVLDGEGSEEEVDLEVDEDDEVMSLGDEGDDATTSNGTIDFRQTRIAKTFVTQLMNPLCKLAFDLEPNSPALTISTANIQASARRGTAIRALSVLNNELLVLASFAQPPPSQPVQDASQKQRIASFHTWLSQQKEQMGQIWRYAFETASRTAASPIVAIDEASQKSDEDVRAAYVEVKRILESSLGIMWSLARCYEGLNESESAQVLLIESDKFAHDSHCLLAGQGGGLIESILAAYRGSTQDSKAMITHDREAALSIADPTTWASVDGVRVNCLGLLSTMCRQAFIWKIYLETIVNFLVQVLQALPSTQKGSSQSQPGNLTALASLELSDWTSNDGMVVAINGLIDTFADENSPWDRSYKSLRIHNKLKHASFEIRHAVRTIDKRTQASLRTAAEEALENLMGFISYRESIKAT